MSTNLKPYKLRSTLLGHSLDVRGVGTGVTEGGKQFIVSASRDRTAKVWIPSELGNFEVFQTCEGHTNFVSCVCIIPPSSKYPNGLILTGSHDHTILGFELGKANPIFRLLGHKGTVCSIACTNDGIFVTGSWDMSAKIWNDQNNIGNLIGHEAAVWAVAVLPSTGRKVLTGSADKTIRLWDETDTSIMVFQGHTDCVRALAVLDGNRFLSASNDSTIRVWSVSEGETINTLYGHTNFIYSLALIDNEDFVSAGEDRTVRIWKGHECRQVLHLPATSVWAVAVMNNGDIAAGSSDGTVRVFTCEPERQACAEELAKYEEEVASTTIAAQQDLGGMKVSQLPGPEALLKEGKKDGDTIMIREGSQVGCFSWSAVDKKWTKVGDVVGASGATQNTSGKVLHDGKEYDYVFSVDLDGTATLKLPYNINEDPWFAAKRFLDKNELSPQFLDQVANFILKNTKGMELGQSNDTNYADPFTGGSRYVPGSGSSSFGAPSGGGLDPYTGAGAYRTQSSMSTTSAGPSSTTGQNAEPCFPCLTFLQFSAAPNPEALKSKLKTFVSEVGAGSTVTDEAINNLVSTLMNRQYTEDVDKLVKYFLSWPKEKVFPILDLLRVGSLNEEFAVALNSQIPIIEQLLNQFVAGPENGTNQMLVFRLISNVFSSPKLLPMLMTHQSLIVSTLLNNLGKQKTNQIAGSTLLLNYSIVVTSSSNLVWLNVETQTEILMAALSLVELLEDSEAIFRLLVALGNLIHYGKTASTTAVELFKSLNGDNIASNFKQNGTLPKIQQCAGQILSLIQ